MPDKTKPQIQCGGHIRINLGTQLVDLQVVLLTFFKCNPFYQKMTFSAKAISRSKFQEVKNSRE